MSHNATHLNPKEIYLALTDPNTFATVIHSVLLAAYGHDIYEVDPVELFLRLEEDFGTKPIEEVENRINAILTATATDLFFEDPEAFQTISETLTTGDPGLELLEPLTLPEAIWGAYEVELNHGPGQFSNSVSKVLDRVMAQESVDAEVAGAEDPFADLHAYLEHQREALGDQLSKIGFKGIRLPPISPKQGVLGGVQ